MTRHGRQSRLAEVGSAGQGQIAASTAEVPLDGLAAEVATRYLAGAGVACVRVREPALAAIASSIDPAVRAEVVTSSPAARPARAADARDALEFHDPSAREVARGAREALWALRVMLGHDGCMS
jgi:hypothetical protein